MNRFEHRTVLVTGAGGDIGAAAALRFATEGAQVALFDRDPSLLADISRRCEDAGATITTAVVDQTSRDAVDAGIAHVLDIFGRIDVLFANAGYGKMSRFLETSAREWDRHVAVNLTGTFNVCQSVAVKMVEASRGGAIVLNASSGAAQHSDLLSAYCSTKAALRMLMIGMASELGMHRIRVNAVMPGVIETRMTSPMLLNNPKHREVLVAETPSGRLGSVEDVASIVAYLASDEAAFITGHAVMVDGGQTIHGHPRWFRADYTMPYEENWEIGR